MIIYLTCFPGFIIISVAFAVMELVCSGSVSFSLPLFVMLVEAVAAAMRNVVPAVAYRPGMLAERAAASEASADDIPGVSATWIASMAGDPLGLNGCDELFVVPHEHRNAPCAVCATAVTAPLCVCKKCETGAHGSCWRYAKGCPRFGCGATPGASASAKKA